MLMMSFLFTKSVQSVVQLIWRDASLPCWLLESRLVDTKSERIGQRGFYTHSPHSNIQWFPCFIPSCACSLSPLSCGQMQNEGFVFEKHFGIDLSSAHTKWNNFSLLSKQIYRVFSISVTKCSFLGVKKSDF